MDTLRLLPHMITRATNRCLRFGVSLATPSHTTVTAITDGEQTYGVVGGRHTPVRLRDLTDRQLCSMGMLSHRYLVNAFREHDQHATLDTTLSFVEWDRLAENDTLCSHQFTSQYGVQDCTTIDTHPHLDLAGFLHPLAGAQTGQPLAVSLPYTGGPYPSINPIITPSMMHVLSVGDAGMVFSSLDTWQASFVERVMAWMRYGMNENECNLMIADPLIRHIGAFATPPTFKGDIFFFTDRAVAITDAPQRLIVMALGGDAPTPSAHHILATQSRLRQALHALRHAPLTDHP